MNRRIAHKVLWRDAFPRRKRSRGRRADHFERALIVVHRRPHDLDSWEHAASCLGTLYSSYPADDLEYPAPKRRRVRRRTCWPDGTFRPGFEPMEIPF